MPLKSRRSGPRPTTKRKIETRFAKANLDSQQASFVVKNTISDPITSKVPVEITTQIFESFVRLRRKKGDLADQPTFGFDEIPAGAPLSLGAVCRRWRDIAWDTPTLWTSLVADLMSKGHAHGPELVKEWLTRTANLPINVALRLHADPYVRHHTDSLVLRGQKKRDAETIVEILNECWSKLKSIDLRDIPWHLSTKFNSDAPSSLKNLCMGGFGSDSVDRDGHCLFRQTTHKHSPTGLSLLSTIPPTLLNLDWSKITTLNIDDFTRETVFEVITLCAATLTNITLKAIRDEDDPEADEDWMPTRIVKLPALIAISFMELGSQEGFSETLFDHITAPMLKSIWYYGMEKDNEMPVDSIISFIQRSCCQIVHFLLHEPFIMILDPEIDGDAYMPLLDAMPALRMLDISLGADLSVEPLFLALAERDPHTDRPTFLPRLKDLKCAVFPTFEWVLFPEIWMASEPRIGDPDFRFSEIRLARGRAKLATVLTLRGPLTEEDYMDEDTLLALVAIKGLVYTDIYVTTDLRGKTALRGRNFLEKSFLHCFSKETHPVYSSILQDLKSEGSMF